MTGRKQRETRKVWMPSGWGYWLRRLPYGGGMAKAMHAKALRVLCLDRHSRCTKTAQGGLSA